MLTRKLEEGSFFRKNKSFVLMSLQTIIWSAESFILYNHSIFKHQEPQFFITMFFNKLHALHSEKALVGTLPLVHKKFRYIASAGNTEI